MTRQNLLFRIFVSSTFIDFVAEREALQTQVFPRLRDYCARRGARFQAIDLRWGVSQDAAMDQQTINICLRELQRCQEVSPRPNFLILLGDRYGWRPLPSQIPAEEFELLLEQIAPDGRELLQWQQRQAEGRKGWYRRDDNTVPPQYVLQPWRAMAPDSISEEHAAHVQEAFRWSREVEPLLRNLLQEAASCLWPADDSRRHPYEDSATHQEIRVGALQVQDATHVMCCFRHIEGLPQDAEARQFVDCSDGGIDHTARDRLRTLKDELRALLPADRVYEYQAKWAEGQIQENLDALCERVERGLREVIDAELAAFHQTPELDREITAHRTFGQHHSKHFVGRQELLQAIGSHLSGGGNRPVVIHGVSGCGKTALLARLADLADHGARIVIFRSIAATPHSTEIRSLLESLCNEIASAYDDQRPVPSKFQELVEDFPRRLALATAQRPLVVLLDALDQLGPSDGARQLGWLPRELPAYAKLIVSVLEAKGSDGDCWSAIADFVPSENQARVPTLALQQGEELLDAWLAEAGRRLQPKQRLEILARFAEHGLPLYLKLALEESHRWKSYDLPEPLAGDVTGLLAQMLVRLEDDRHHGPALTRFALGCLASARHGLTEDELLDVLSAEEVMADFRRRSPHSPTVDHLPVVVWARFHADVEAYLTTRQTDNTVLLSFYHHAVRVAVIDHYLQPEEKQLCHRALARYFEQQPHWLDEPAYQTPSLRKVSELPYQQILAGLVAELEETLSDLAFVQAKCEAGMTFDLEQDYQRALSPTTIAAPESFVLRHPEVVQALARFVERCSHILESHPDNVLQEAWNFEQNGPVFAAAQVYLNRLVRPGYLWIKRNHRPESPEQSPLQRTFKRPKGYLRGLAVSVNGDLAAARYGKRSGFVRKLEGEGTTLLMLHLGEGRVIWEQAATIRAMTFCQDRETRYFVTGELAGRLRIWEAGSGRCLYVLQADAGEVTALAAPRHGAIFASGHEDGKILFWSANIGECLGSVAGHRQRARSLSFTPDGELLVSTGDDNRMLAWDVIMHRQLGEFEWYVGQHEPRACSISAMVLSFDAQVLATGVQMRYGGNLVRGVMARIRLWDVETGRCVRVLEGHEDGISCLALSQDGQTLVSSGFDDTWKVWDVKTGHCRLTRPGKYYGTAAGVSEDGRLVLSNEFYKDLVLWETETGRVLHTWDGFKDVVDYISITPEASLALVCSRQKVAILNLTTREVIYRGEPDDDTCVFRIAANEDGKFHCIHTSGITADDLNNWLFNPDGRMAFRIGDGFFELWDIARSRRKPEEKSANSWTIPWYRGFRVVGDQLIGVTEWSRSGESDAVIWDVLHNEPLAQLDGDRTREALFALGGNGKVMVTRDEDNLIRVWSLHPLTCLRLLPGHMDIGFNVIGTSDDKRATRIDAVTDLPLLLDDTGAGAAPDPSVLRFGPDGTLAVTSSEDGQRVYHIPSCRRWSHLLGKNQAKEQIRFSADGKSAVSAGFDEPLGFPDTGPGIRGGRKIVHFWSVRHWDRIAGICTQQCTGLEEDVAYLAADDRLGRVLTGYYSGTIQLWRLGGGRHETAETERGRWALSRDGRLLVGGSSGQPRFHDLLHEPDFSEEIGPLREWQPSPLDRLGNTPPVIAWCTTSSLAILSNWSADDPDLLVFQLDTGQMINRLQGHTQPAASILMVQGGAIAFSGANDRAIRVWDVTRGQCLAVLPVENESCRLVHAFHDARVAQGTTLSADAGQASLKSWRILVQHTFGAFSVLDASTGATVREIHRSSVIREDPVGILPDGFGIMATSGSSIWTFDARTGKARMVLEGHTDIVQACAFHAGAGVAVSSQWTGDTRLWVWDLADGRVLARLDGHQDEIKAVALTNDGRHALTGSPDKTIRVWDLRKRECVRTFYLDGPVTALWPVQANGVFCAVQERASTLLQLCRGWPTGIPPGQSVSGE